MIYMSDNATTKKRGKRGEGSIYKNADGTWTAKFNQKGYERKEWTRRTKAAAKAELDAYKELVRSGNLISLSLTFDEYAKKFLKFKEAQVNRGRLKNTSFDSIEKNYINHFLGTPFGKIKLRDLTSEDIQRFIDEKSENYSLSTIMKFYWFIHSLIDYAVKVKDLPKTFDPFENVEPPNESALKVKTKEIQIMTSSQLKAFKEVAMEIDSTGNYCYRYGPALVLMANIGVRQGELVAISKNNIKRDGNGRMTLYIDSTISRVIDRDEAAPTKYKKIITDPKYKNSIRTLPLNKEAEFCIKEMIGLYPENKFSSDLLISTKNGNPPTVRNIQTTLDRILKRAGMPHVGTHALRHTFATELLKGATSLAQLKDAAELMGEDYHVMVKTYLHTDHTTKFELMDKLVTS